MKSPFAPLLIVVLSALACSMDEPAEPAAVPAAADPDSTARTLLRIDREIMEPLVLRNDPSGLLAHAHEDYVVVAPGGRIEDLAQAVAGAAAFRVSALRISDEQVTIAGPTAVVVGKIEMDGEMRPVGRLPPTKFMAVFVKQGTAWKLLSRALTPCLPLAIERGLC